MDLRNAENVNRDIRNRYAHVVRRKMIENERTITADEKESVSDYIKALFELADGLDERKKNSKYDRDRLIALLKR